MQLVSTETKTHTIEISDGCLTIGEHTFPDNCVTLSPEDTQAVLNVLPAAQHQLEQMDVETDTHLIEISEGCLTIGEHTFPDNCVSLSPEATQVVRLLLVVNRGEM